MKKEIKRRVIEWWFSQEGKMTNERAVIVDKTIEISLKESHKELLEIYNRYKVSDTYRINSLNHQEFIKTMEEYLKKLKCVNQQKSEGED